MRIASLLQLRDGHLKSRHVYLRVIVVKIRDFQRLAATDLGDFPILQIDGFLRVLHERSRVRRQKKFIVPDTDDQRAALAGHYYRVRIVLLQNCNGIGADHLLKSAANRLKQCAFVGETHIFDELNKHFRVRF